MPHNMMLFSWLVTTLLCLSSLIKAISLESDQKIISPSLNDAPSIVHDALVSSSIISEVLDDFTPEVTISLSYNSSHEKVFLGNEIPVSAVASRPIIDFRPTNNVTYTLILTDPDAKSRYNPKWSEMCHWIISNITTNSFRTSDFTLTRTEVGASELIPYAPPAPPPKTGKHRYVFVLLSGETRNITAPGERQHWGYGKKRTGVQRWADEMGLKVVGANFFYAQNEKQ